MPAVKGKEIRERRQRLGLKLGEFAKASRIAYKTAANIESKSGQPVSIEVVYRFAKILGVEDATDLLEKTDAVA
jgi:transcriptional regulator with XRE-family HTH domain